MKYLTIIFMAVLLVASSSFASATYNPHTCPAGSYLTAETDAVAFANVVVSTSGAVVNANNALGLDDNQYTFIKSTRPDSYIVLDMGEGEEIWDRFGLDFKMYQDNSREFGVAVYVSNDPDSGWKYVGSSNGKGDDNFAIGYTGYDSVRYVKIVNMGYKIVEIDAVRGYCISEQTTEEVPEFGTLAALGVLGLAGLFIHKKRGF